MPFGLMVVLYSFYVAVLLYVSWTDLRTRRIPNVVIGPALLVALAAMPWTIGIVPGLLGAIIAPLPLIVARIVSGARQVGMGDIKLAIVIGTILGAPVALWGVLLSLILALIVGGIGIVRGRYTLRSKLPFGPFLAVGALSFLVLNLVRF